MVTFEGRALLVRQRLSDGSLAAEAAPFTIRGVVWSPASPDTNSWGGNPNHAEVMRAEFARWQAIDVPLLAQLGVNTVRILVDPGVDEIRGPIGRRLLDALYAAGIMVIMNVDNGVNDLARVRAVVEYYRDHPAILMWMLGVEWNVNNYYGVADSVLNAAYRTEQAAALIKRLDPHHPVASSYGEIDWPEPGHRLADTANYVNNICSSVDVWALNIYRGESFGNLFEQWASITTRPMFLGEFGTDAYRSESTQPNPPGAIDEKMQADWNLGLWHHLSANMVRGSEGVAVGGTLFSWNDEWWKVAPAGSQQSGGFTLPSWFGHPDRFANEEYFGLVDIFRVPRQAFGDLQRAFRGLRDDGISPIH